MYPVFTTTHALLQAFPALCDWFCVTFWVMQLFWVLFASTYLVAEPSTAWLAGQVLFRLVSILASWRILYFPVLFEYPVGLPQFADHLNLHLFFFVLQFWFYLHVIMMSAEGNWGFFSNCIRRVNWDYVQELVRAFGLVTAILSLF